MEDQYDIGVLIGEGSFGRVFRGRHKTTKDIVALKIITKSGKSEKEIENLRKEFEIQKDLNHPNIVRIIETFETKSRLISVTEYVPGELHKLFDVYKDNGRKRRLPEAKVREIAIDLMSALFYLHQNRILHRDIKPQNILIDTQGRAKLCDFGFARNLSLDTHVLTSIKGTPLYMAPELIQEQPYDYAADIWSLGCILYELSVGEPPFSTKSIFNLINKVRYDAIVMPQDMSNTLRGFLQGLLEKDFKKRSKWPALLKHPFVHDHFVKNPPTNLNEIPDSLTEPLSESQEFAKEIQRQDKAKLLSGGSQTLIKVAHKYEEQKKKLQSMVDKQKYDQAMLLQQQHQRHRRSSDVNLISDVREINNHRSRRHSDMSFYNVLQQQQQQPHQFSAEAWNTLQQAQYLIPQPPTLPQFTAQAPSEVNKPEPIKAPPIEVKTDKEASEGEEDEVGGDEEEEINTSIENDEWCEFLDGQIEEALKEVEVLNNHNYIDMIVGPLKNPMTGPLVLEKIITILILPFTSKSKMGDDQLMKNLLDGYKAVKVMDHLIQAIGYLRAGENLEDAESMIQSDKTLSLATTLVTRLVHTGADFAKIMSKVFLKMGEEKLTTLLLWLLMKRQTSNMDCLAWMNRMLDLSGVNFWSQFEIMLTEPVVLDLINEEDSGVIKRLCICLCFMQKYKRTDKLTILKHNSKNLIARLRKSRENLELPKNIQNAVDILLQL